MPEAAGGSNKSRNVGDPFLTSEREKERERERCAWRDVETFSLALSLTCQGSTYGVHAE